VLRAAGEPRSHRVQRNIARRHHQMVLVHGDGADARLKQASGHAQPRIDESAIAPVPCPRPARGRRPSSASG
jgi:hypothetical protein